MDRIMKAHKGEEVILNIFITVILASFGIWLIGGITYNVFQKEQIHQRILALEKKAYDIEPLEAYDVSDFQLTNRRAIIAKSIRTYIKPITSDKSPQIVKEEFLQYFMSHGWNIKHAWENPKPYLQVQNDDYIVTLDLVSQETNTWRMIIAYNNFSKEIICKNAKYMKIIEKAFPFLVFTQNSEFSIRKAFLLWG